MRELLYRAKAINRIEGFNYRTDYKNGDWVVGLISKLDKYSASMTNEDGVSGIDIDRDTICEYSGEHDKRFKRIFEGDVLRDDNGFIYQVVFENGAFCLVAVTDYNIPYDTLPREHNLDEFMGELADNIVSIFALKWNNLDWQNSFEIIGNIYDNPEWLGGNK